MTLTLIVAITVLLPYRIDLPDTARLRVEVRDVSLLDAPSVTLCSRDLTQLSVDGKVLATLELEVPAGDEHRTLNVWAHLSLSGEEQIKKGDFLTTRAYPIKRGANSDYVTIELQQI